jgi:hypothetical protein
VITRSEMFEPLLEVYPAFAPDLQQISDDYADEDQLPSYIALGELAHHLIERIERGETTGIAEVFSVVERWHVEGDDYVREAASVGLLEGLQNIPWRQCSKEGRWLNKRAD